MREPDASFRARRHDWQRHIVDLQTRTYDGASSRADRETTFREAFNLATPVALGVLEELAAAYLGAGASISVSAPDRVMPDQLRGAERTPTGGLLGSWNLTWPALQRARSRFTGRTLPPVQIFAMFPDDFTHGHLALCDLDDPRTWVACWPFQVTSSEDAHRQLGILAAIAEADMHERTFAGDLNWRLLDIEEGG